MDGMHLFPHLLKGSIGLVLLLSSPMHGAAIPEGWVVAPYSDIADLRHSNAFERDDSEKWRVALVDGKVEATNQRCRPDSEATWENSGMPPRAKKLALRLGQSLVDQPPEYALRTIERVPDGWLVGFNAGEWGGGLCWVSTDGSRGCFLMTSPHLQLPPPPPKPPGVSKKQWAKETRPRHKEPSHEFPGWLPSRSFNLEDHSSENVLQIERSKDSYLIVQGLDHMGLNHGKIMKVSRNNKGEWTATQFARLDGTPRYFTQDTTSTWLLLTSDNLVRLDSKGTTQESVPLPNALKDGEIMSVMSEGDGQWLVLTEQYLYRLSAKGNSRLLLSAGFMSSPEMNAMVRTQDGTVFIGMRHYLLRLIPKDDTGYAVERLECVNPTP